MDCRKLNAPVVLSLFDDSISARAVCMCRRISFSHAISISFPRHMGSPSKKLVTSEFRYPHKGQIFSMETEYGRDKERCERGEGRG